MRIKAIELDDDENPDAITTILTGAEALYLAKVVGGHNDFTANEIMAGGAPLNHEIYSALVGGVFNKFYEDGVSDALRIPAFTNSNSETEK